jgi:hypothetical protein
MAVLWDVKLCNLVEFYWRFRGAYCLNRPIENFSETSIGIYQTTEDSHLPSIHNPHWQYFRLRM